MNGHDFSFPDGFVWGVAAASAQIEGGAHAGGKGPSVWDHYAKQVGAIRNGDNLDVACDHYNRFAEDFKIMRELGIRHYRLSIAWPRIYPDGEGEVNAEGLRFYHRLFDEMEANGITPWVTLFHWDLPQALESRLGGWRSRKVVDAFAQYADTVLQSFGERVRHWFTINEMVAFTANAYGRGRNAPGLSLDEKTVTRTYHHALLCHGHAVRAVREYGQPGSIVGLVDNPMVAMPLDESKPEDLEAARTCFKQDSMRVLNPIYHGAYTDEYIEMFGEDVLPDVQAGDFSLISSPCDFLGLNLYWGYYVRAGENAEPQKVDFPESYPSASSWWQKLTPRCMYWGVRHVHDLYGPKTIYITENGCGYTDEVVVDGECLDLHRRDFVRSCLMELHAAIAEGIDVKGYFLWSLLDNFEWSQGYSIRFGIIHIDYETLKRTPKLSARWYAQVIATNTLSSGSCLLSNTCDAL